MNHDIIPMLVISVISGLLSTMNVWVNQLDDMRFSINDVYMSLLMTGWMFLFYGIYHQQTNQIYLGALLVISSLVAIRGQFLVDKSNFVDGMIPHHSMAIFMSNMLKNKNDDPKLNIFLDNIITTQSKEIKMMKNNEL